MAIDVQAGWQRIAERQDKKITRLQARIAERQDKKITRLQAALEWYGKHLPCCPLHETRGPTKCNCGFEQALKGQDDGA